MNISPVSFLSASTISSLDTLYSPSRIQRKPAENNNSSLKNNADTSLQKMSAFSVYSPTSEKTIAPTGSFVDFRI